jgi:hypothetical protein
MSGQEYLRGVAAELPGIPVDPGNRATQFVNDRIETVADVLHPAEIGYDVVDAGVDEQLCRECVAFGRPLLPGPAVDEDMNRGVRCIRPIQVERLDVSRSIGEFPRLAQMLTNQVAVRPVTGHHLRCIWCVLRL